MRNRVVFVRIILAILSFASAVTLSGCGSLIASTDLHGSRHRLNDAVTVTTEEQLLLALVQTRFVHNPGFLDVSVINTQLNWSAGIGGSYSTNPSTGSVSPSIDYSESPTITYTPLQGQEFVRRMMVPVSLETLAMLMETGWSSDAVLRLVVQRINDIPNGFDGSIADLEIAPEYRTFNRVARLFDRLIGHGVVFLTKVPDNHYPIESWDWNNPANLKHGEILKNTWEASDNPIMLNVRRELRKKGDSESDLTELLDLLDIPLSNLKPRNKFNPRFDSIILQNAMRPAFEGDIWLHTRSMQEILYALSWAVQVPADAKQRGEVSVVKDGDGRPFEWNKMFKGLLTIHWSPSEPGDAAIAVPYQGNWYYVRRNDVPSKRTFVLLGQLTKMLSGLGSGVAPALTLPL